MKKLVGKGANINAETLRFGTPFHIAILQENLEMMSLLKKLKADIHIPVTGYSYPNKSEKQKEG